MPYGGFSSLFFAPFQKSDIELSYRPLPCLQSNLSDIIDETSIFFCPRAAQLML